MTTSDTAAPSDTAVPFTVRRLSGSIGAEISDLDLRRIDEATVAAIRQVWLDRKVVFFRGQHLEPAEHLAFARRFGEPTEGHPVLPGLDGQPEIFEIDYTKGAELYEAFGEQRNPEPGVSWHTDVTFVERPPMGSVLRAVTVPDHGGDTLFADQAAAFAGLSPTLQEFLSTLTAVHDGLAQVKGILDAVGEGRWEGKPFTEIIPSEHPVVRVHPETGERSLFVNPQFTSHITQLGRRESDALLGLLYDHSTRPEYTVRHHWTAGDVGFWDNRSTQHAVVGDFGAHHRAIQRVTLRGDEPRGIPRPS